MSKKGGRRRRTLQKNRVWLQKGLTRGLDETTSVGWGKDPQGRKNEEFAHRRWGKPNSYDGKSVAERKGKNAYHPNKEKRGHGVSKGHNAVKNAMKKNGERPATLPGQKNGWVIISW